MKVVVNSGNIGTPTALMLAKQGHDVTLASRSVKANPDWDKLGLRQAAFDISDSNSMETALRDADVFFSVSPLVENLVEAGVKMVHAAKRAGVKRLVRSSAQGAGPEAGIQLGRLHGAVEAAITESGIPFTILRPANFMQNYFMFETIKSQDSFYAPLGMAKVSAIDTRDISAVAATVVVEPGHLGKFYDLTGGESLSSDEVASIFSKVLRRTIRFVDVPEQVAQDSMAQAGVPAWLIRLLSELNAIAKAGYLAEVKPDVENILKRKPISFEQFASDYHSKFLS